MFNATLGTEKPAQPDQPSPGRVRRIIVPAMLLVCVSLVAFLGRAWWDTLSLWIESSGSWGYLVFFLTFVLLTTFCFPVSVLGFSAGAMFGPGLGLLLLFCSGVASGSIMFAVGRYLFRGRIQNWASTRPKLAALDRLAEQRALRLNLLARLSPLNYGIVCYTLASGKTPFACYCLGMLAIVPSMAAQVWLGGFAVKASQAASGQQDQSPMEWALLAGGLVFFIMLSWQISRLVRQAWQEAAPDENTPGKTEIF